MALRRSDIAKLCFGRIVLVEGIFNSTGEHVVHPHYAVVLDSDVAEIQATQSVTVAVITSSPNVDERFAVPIPARTGLEGNVLANWIPDAVEFRRILKVLDDVLLDFEMVKVMRAVNDYFASE